MVDLDEKINAQNLNTCELSLLLVEPIIRPVEKYMVKAHKILKEKGRRTFEANELETFVMETMSNYLQ